MSERPNILLFFTDDQRFDTIGALGHPVVKTPNIDQLVNDGTAFTHAHIPGGTCGAVCMPSRAMLHTGRTLFHIDGRGETINAGHTMLGQHLQAQGYTCFGTGKWHNEREAYARSFNCGSDIFFGGMADHWNVPVYAYDPEGKYEAVCPEIKDAYHSNEVTIRQCDHIHSGVHSSHLLADAAITFLEGHDGAKPFFLYTALLAPHDPRTMPEEFKNMYDPADMELPPNFLTQHPHDTGALAGRDEMLAAIPRVPEEVKQHIAEYYGMISHLDHELGRVIKALKDKGEYDNTIIVFAGDNGLAVGQHGLMGKQCLYEHSVRVPLVFSGPGIPSGEKRDALVYLLDIFPTLCDLTGLETPATVEGQSMAACIKGETDKHREILYLAYERHIRGVTDGKSKLIEYTTGGVHVTQLFDLETDPWERNNLAEESAMADELARLRKELFRLRDEWDDPAHPVGAPYWENYPGQPG